MRNEDGLSSLSAFYAELDSVPTPSLLIRPKRVFGILALILAPAGAALGAFVFISLCCSGISPAPSAPPVRILLDQYAKKELQEQATASVSDRHASLMATVRGLS